MITSKTNQNVMQARKLLQKKERVLQGKYLIEGEKLLLDAIKHGCDIEHVFLPKEKAEIFVGTGEEVFVCSGEVLSTLAETKTTQGVFAVVKSKPCTFDKNCTKGIFLDRVQDPKNVGSILRTALACGYKDVFLLGSADAYGPQALRAGMSAQFGLNTHIVDFAQTEQLLAGKNVICADMEGQSIFDFDGQENHILILGNEGSGVCSEVEKFATSTVKIPMKNNLESLNVSVSAGVLMYFLSKNNWR